VRFTKDKSAFKSEVYAKTTEYLSISLGINILLLSLPKKEKDAKTQY
jgi:hypothetical protein